MIDKSILLVENNPSDVEHSLRFFKRENINNKVVLINNGVETLDYLFGTGVYEGRRNNGIPILIILNSKLPKMDGIQLLWRLRSDDRTKFIPVVILTSSDEDQDIVKYSTVGNTTYISKPIDFTQFSKAMNQLWL